MTWDDDKSTATDPDNPAADEQLTADEWDNHVSQGHFPSDELNLGVNGNGDPVFTDPQNADQEVLRYDRSEGQWVLSALTTDNIVDNADGQAWETLKEAGFEKGDTVWTLTSGPGSDSSHQTVSNSYENSNTFMTLRFTWDDQFPGTVQGRVVGRVFVNIGSGETVDIRIRDITQSETVAEETGVSAGWIELGPVDHEPSDPTTPSTFRWELRTNPGTNSSSIADHFTQFGFRL